MAVLFVSLPCSSVWAVQPETSDKTFTHWLKTYGAWDIYEQEVSGEAATPENLLARGQAYLRLNRPKKVLTLFPEPFNDAVQESRRLILLAQANRLVGDYQACIFHWLAFAKISASEQNTRNIMRKEQGLGLLFEDVWQQWFWECYFTENAALFATRHPMLTRISDLGALVWPRNPFWKQARPVFTQVSNLFAASHSSSMEHNQTQEQPASIQEISIHPDRKFLGKALAAWSLGFWEQGDALLNQVKDQRLVQFWSQFALLVGHPVKEQQEVPQQSIRPDFFTLFAPKIRAIHQWLLVPPDIPSWPSFALKLQSLDHVQALERVATEQKSLFLPESVQYTLNLCTFALNLQEQGEIHLQKDWDALFTGEHTPPLLLQLAYMILGGHSPMPQEVSRAIVERYLLTAALVPSKGGVLEDFWKPSPPKANNATAQADTSVTTAAAPSFPLDYLLEYNTLAKKITTTPGRVPAIQLAFLYPHSPAAQKGLLVLARLANTNGYQRLAWTYLQKIRTKDLNASDRTEFLLARAGMEMELGYEDAALKDYALLMKERPERIPPEKQLKLALLAQQKRQWGWAQQILDSLWEHRAALKEPLRAEVLFWLGEGNQAQGKMQEALTCYLRLAWRYPKQNIWAITALYRAGLIYEKRKQFETAKRLYTTVLKQSDRKSQKEAAKTRIASVTADMKKNRHPLPLF